MHAAYYFLHGACECATVFFFLQACMRVPNGYNNGSSNISEFKQFAVHMNYDNL